MVAASDREAETHHPHQRRTDTAPSDAPRAISPQVLRSTIQVVHPTVKHFIVIDVGRYAHARPVIFASWSPRFRRQILRTSPLRKAFAYAGWPGGFARLARGGFSQEDAFMHDQPVDR